jgi:hypothetical protein
MLTRAKKHDSTLLIVGFVVCGGARGFPFYKCAFSILKVHTERWQNPLDNRRKAN